MPHAANSNRKNSPQNIAALAALAAERKAASLPYAGEVTPQEAYAFLQTHAEAMLVDVRTMPEWQFVGETDLSATPARAVRISWKHYPNFAINPDFAAQLLQAGATPQTPLFFLCRSGGRSLDAANCMAAQGLGYCFNVTDGFEGEPDAGQHRATSGGWKASGLPWKQG